MKKPVPITVNLLPKDPFFSSPLGKFLQWALSVGRYLVIFTEMVVILSFASRFYIDRRITDLNGAIHQKQIIIESYGELEQNVRNVQNKIESYQQIQQQVDMTDSFEAMSQITPADVVLQSLNMKPDSVIFSGKALSQASLNLLVNNIQLSPHFSDVVINRIQVKNANNIGFEFEIQAKVKR